MDRPYLQLRLRLCELPRLDCRNDPATGMRIAGDSDNGRMAAYRGVADRGACIVYPDPLLSHGIPLDNIGVWFGKVGEVGISRKHDLQQTVLGEVPFIGGCVACVQSV